MPAAPNDLESALGSTSGSEPTQKGFQRLASLMSVSEHGIFKKFDHLALLNILYMQSELWDLKTRLEKQVAADAVAGGRRSLLELSWFDLSNSSGEDSKQWQIILEIKGKLSEYYGAVLQYAEINNLRKPTEHQRRILGKWISSKSLNKNSCKLMAREFMGESGPAIFAPDQQQDLVLLQAGEEENDMLSRYLVVPLFKALGAFRKPHKADDSQGLMCLYPSQAFRGLNRVVGALIGASAPLVSVIVLYRVSDPAIKLGLLCLFTLVFCLGLSLLSRARRIEVFAATATYSAVLVVFVSGTNGGTSNGTG